MAVAKGMLPCWAAFSQTWEGPPSVSRLAGEAHPAVLAGGADPRRRCSEQTGVSVSGAATALAAAGRAMKAKGARTKLKKKRPAGLGFSTPRVSDEPVTGYDTGPKLLEILKYPHPALRRPNAEVTDFGPKLRQLSENLFRTMYAKDNGCGLAAPQCGVNLRVMVYNYQRIEGEGRKPEGEVVFVNPRITAHSEEECEMLEGCLSFPNFGAPVVRPAWVEVQAVDLDGSPQLG
ncbi:PDF1B [Symbiodinium sp. CCMP2456]|nr:PDF1B [Symbiodinium sp. CCMP2456]